MTALMNRLLPVFGLCVLALWLLGATPVPVLPQPPNAAMIYNPGSGDYFGFRIVVQPDGRAISVDGAGHASTQLASDVAQKFFADLGSAAPLGQLTAGTCDQDQTGAASTTVEVNAAIVISWRGGRTAPLSCATDSRAQKLLLDATQIQHALYVQAYRHRTLSTYDTSYLSDRSAAAGSGLGSALTFDQFYSAGSANATFDTSTFTMDHFSLGGFAPASPYSSLPGSSIQFSSLPSASVPWASPFVSLPSSTPVFTSPFSSSPYSGAPFVALPTSGLSSNGP